MGNSHAIWDHTVLPATLRKSRLYPNPKQVLDLATQKGCKVELTNRYKLILLLIGDICVQSKLF